MDPMQNTPVDPAAAGQMSPDMGMPPVDQGAPSGMATPEQLAELKTLMDNIEEKYRQMNAEAFAGGNQTEAQRKDLVKEVFSALQEAGVDLNNQDSVKQFLDQLQQDNPDLYDLFVSSFEGLLGGGDTAGIPEEAAGTTAPGGALSDLAGAPMPGGAAPAAMPETPGSIPGGVPSNEGLAGMSPTSGGIASKFPNLAK